MRSTFRFSVAVALASVAAPAAAAQAGPAGCAALDYIFAQARTEFPALRNTKFNAGKCRLVRQEFKCEWGFPGDTFAAAEEQASRLEKCAAAQPGARALGEKRGELGFELNPETSVYLHGPEMDSGHWKLRLRIVSTNDWD